MARTSLSCTGRCSPSVVNKSTGADESSRDGFRYPFRDVRSDKTTTTFLWVEVAAVFFTSGQRVAVTFANYLFVWYVLLEECVKWLFFRGLGRGTPPLDSKEADPQVRFRHFRYHYC